MLFRPRYPCRFLFTSQHCTHLPSTIFLACLDHYPLPSVFLHCFRTSTLLLFFFFKSYFRYGRNHTVPSP
ncbi:hypothetical protein B0H14DRAFT_3877320, partial [Mycena olivaceomarginata]